MSGRTIEIKVDTDTGSETKHFNVDNITFLEASYTNLTDFARAVQLGTTAVVLLALLEFLDLLWAIVGAGVAFFVVSSLLYVPDDTQVGTVTKTYALDGDPQPIEDQFLAAIREAVTIEGGETTRYHDHTYRYHIVPENTVSISHEHREALALGYLLGGVGVLAVAGALFLNLPDVLLLLGLGLVAVGVYVDPIPQPDAVTIEFGTGETETFEMATPDARALVDEFQNRSDGHTTIQTTDDAGAIPGDKQMPAFEEFDEDPEVIQEAIIDPESADLESFDDDLREFIEETNDEFTWNLFGDFADQLRSHDPEERREALGMVDGTRVDVNNFGRVVVPLLELYASTDHPEERDVADDVLYRIARRAPKHYADAIDRLCALLDHDDPDVRRTAADLLETVADEHPDEVAASVEGAKRRAGLDG